MVKLQENAYYLCCHFPLIPFPNTVSALGGPSWLLLSLILLPIGKESYAKLWSWNKPFFIKSMQLSKGWCGAWIRAPIALGLLCLLSSQVAYILFSLSSDQKKMVSSCSSWYPISFGASTCKCFRIGPVQFLLWNKHPHLTRLASKSINWITCFFILTTRWPVVFLWGCCRCHPHKLGILYFALSVAVLKLECPWLPVLHISLVWEQLSRAWVSYWPAEVSTESAAWAQVKAIHLCCQKGWILAPLS